ncbi:hypothetical protein ABPG75_001076 [Micractinium tetrahymenae]
MGVEDHRQAHAAGRRAHKLKAGFLLGAFSSLALIATTALMKQSCYAPEFPASVLRNAQLDTKSITRALPPPQQPPSSRRQPQHAVLQPPPSARPAGSSTGGPSTALRQFILPWEPLLRQEDVERGMAYWGSGGRLRRISAKLLAGQAIKAVTLGGSVTYGNGASSPGRAYAGRFFEFIRAAFPHRGHVLENKGMGAAGSGIFAACLDRMVPRDLDLAVIDFTVNDAEEAAYDSAERRGYEQLLRKLLKLSSRPAIIQLHHHRWWHVADGSNNIEEGAFYHTPAEAQLLVFAQYYDFPAISVRSTVHPLMRAGIKNFRIDRVLDKGWNPTLGGRIPRANPKHASSYFYWDKSHPTDAGHQVLAELLASALLRAVAEESAPPGATQAAAGLAAWRKGSRLEDASRKQPALPPPMIPGNSDAATTLCAIQEDFKGTVVASQGFTYRPERPQAKGFVAQKWAWTGTQPGDWVEFDSRADASREGPGNSSASSSIGGSSSSTGKGGGSSGGDATVYLIHLKSFEGMGTAAIECVAGCSCSRRTLDGTWDTPASLQQMRKFTVSQHPRCRVRISVRSVPGEVPQKGHKVALFGLLVSHYPLKMSMSQQGSVELMAQRTAGSAA